MFFIFLQHINQFIAHMKKSGKLTEVENLYQNVFPILSNYSSI